MTQLYCITVFPVVKGFSTIVPIQSWSWIRNKLWRVLPWRAHARRNSHWLPCFENEARAPAVHHPAVQSTWHYSAEVQLPGNNCSKWIIIKFKKNKSKQKPCKRIFTGQVLFDSKRSSKYRMTLFCLRKFETRRAVYIPMYDFAQRPLQKLKVSQGVTYISTQYRLVFNPVKLYRIYTPRIWCPICLSWFGLKDGLNKKKYLTSIRSSSASK